MRAGRVRSPSPACASLREVFSKVGAGHGVGGDHGLLMPQAELDGRKLDTRDRVQVGAAQLRDLVKAGLEVHCIRRSPCLDDQEIGEPPFELPKSGPQRWPQNKNRPVYEALFHLVSLVSRAYGG